ncbi:MAG TPA: hypothetical protein VFV99_23760 [Kofleriaceae bacterium]|nr:hypothetical protein [Kofleriaceae bacterium]
MKTLNWLLAAGLMTLVGACAEGGDDDLSDASELSLSANAFSHTKIVGDVDLGFSRSVLYKSSPRYRAVRFHAEAGTMLEVYVRSTHGDPTTWLTDVNFKVIAHNDDANEETSSNISIESLAKTGDYYVVFRDKHYESHYFDVAPVQLDLPAHHPMVPDVETIYEALVASHTLATKQISGDGLPFLAKGLYARFTSEAAAEGAQAAAYAIEVDGETVWLVRKYKAGEYLVVGAYVESGPMLGIAGGTSELIDNWEY